MRSNNPSVIQAANGCELTSYGIHTIHDLIVRITTPVPRGRQFLSLNAGGLAEGRFLLGTVDDLVKEQYRNVRDSLAEEFEAETPTDFMLIDLAVSNYMRTMQAMQTEMFEVVTQGLQPYIHDCQNQLLKMLRILQARKQTDYNPHTFTHETYSKTEINLEKWGLPLLHASADITERKEEKIGIDEIKQAMTKHLKDLDIQAIPNSWIGNALRRYGFTDKIHESDGNYYNIPKESIRILLLAYEGLKS